jgi:hypothetical protein
VVAGGPAADGAPGVPVTKRCSKCTRALPASAFAKSKDRSDGLAGWCKECFNAFMRNGGKRRSLLKRTYGLTVEQYDAILAGQRGGCAVCGHPPKPDRVGRKHLHVDHNHADGRVRGLLCSPCNTALGLLREDPEVITKLWRYIEKDRERIAEEIGGNPWA